MSFNRFFLTIVLIAVAMTTVASQSWAADTIDVTRVNMLSNYGFEEGNDLAPVDWKFVNVHEAMEGLWADGEGLDGSTCLMIKGGGGLSYGWWKTTYRVILEPGKQYTLGGFHRGDEAIALLYGYAVDYDAENTSYCKNVDKRFQRNSKIESSENWQPFEKTFGVPNWGHPIWAEVRLQAGGDAEAYFDNLYLVGQSCTLIEPKVSQVVKPAERVNITVALCDGEANSVSDVVSWAAYADDEPLDIISSQYDNTSALWYLDVRVPEEVGVYDLLVGADWSKREDASFVKSKFLNVNANEDEMFSFAVFADAHIYAYPNDNERNQKFMQMVSALNVMDPLFVIGVGDLRGISNGFDDARVKYMCDGYDHMTSQLTSPVYNIAGNHDTDKSDIGVQTRWYYSHYMGNPLYYSFDVANFHFVGIDTNTIDIYGKDHLGSFSLPGQKEWLATDLAKANDEGRFTVVYYHEPVYEGGQFYQDENWKSNLDIFYKNNVKLVLEGHNHHNWIVTKKNPYKTGSSSLEEIDINPDDTTQKVDIYKYYNDPLFTIFEQTTTVSAFIMREAKYFGYRYLVVRDGRVIYDDAIPISFAIEKTRDLTDEKSYTIRTGPEKSFVSMPLKFTFQEGGDFEAKVNGKNAPCIVIPNGNVVDVWVRMDVPADAATTVDVRKE